jgi:hypothetical protein
MHRMKQAGLKIMSEGGLDNFLGINIEDKRDGSFELTQT